MPTPITDGNTTVETDGRAYFRDAKIQEEGMLSLRARPLQYEGLVREICSYDTSEKYPPVPIISMFFDLLIG